MRTLHIFGDSFSQPFKEDWVWPNQIGKKLKVNALSNNSHIGVSNDWIFSNIREAILGKQKVPLIKNDVVIFVLTSPHRYWFFKDKPQFSNYMISNWDEFVPKNKIDAIKGYTNHIQRDELDLIRMEFQVGWLKQMHNQIGFDLLIIPGFSLTVDFSGIPEVLGDLTGSVSNAEFVTPGEDTNWYRQGIDTRYNHLCKDNHDILADKCVSSLMTGRTLDLCVGFKRHFLRADERYTSKQVGPSLIPHAKELTESSVRDSTSPHWLTDDK